MLYRPIAVFDSGLGSLSVVRELRKIVPSENILYFADKKNFPYGNKTKSELKSIMLKSINFLEKYQPKLIVMASNTPSVQIYDEIAVRESERRAAWRGREVGRVVFSELGPYPRIARDRASEMRRIRNRTG